MGDLRLIGGHEYRYWKRGCLDPAIHHPFHAKAIRKPLKDSLTREFGIHSLLAVRTVPLKSAGLFRSPMQLHNTRLPI